MLSFLFDGTPFAVYSNFFWDFVVISLVLLILAVGLKWFPAIGAGTEGDLGSRFSHCFMVSPLRELFSKPWSTQSQMNPPCSLSKRRIASQ